MYEGTVCEESLKSHETFVEKSWNGSGKVMKWSWKSHEMAVEKSWNGHGKVLKWPFKSHEMAVEKSRNPYVLDCNVMHKLVKCIKKLSLRSHWEVMKWLWKSHVPNTIQWPNIWCSTGVRWWQLMMGRLVFTRMLCFCFRVTGRQMSWTALDNGALRLFLSAVSLFMFMEIFFRSVVYYCNWTVIRYVIPVKH